MPAIAITMSKIYGLTNFSVMRSLSPMHRGMRWDRIEAMDGIEEVAVVGVPDDTWGEVGRAYVGVDPDARVGVEELDSWLSGQLARYKMPRSYVFLPALPRTATGKIHKPGLKTLEATVEPVRRGKAAR